MRKELSNKITMKLQISILLIATAYLSTSNAMKCDRIPEGTGSSKSPPDGRFRLRIINDPIRYIPGETYRISVEGVTRYSSPSPQKFVGFFLTADNDRPSYLRNDEEDLGSFSIVNSVLSKISEKCPNLVVNTNSVPKSDVVIEWTAPASGKGCITFKSTIIEHRDVWFMDDGALSKTLCEDEADSFDVDGIIQECTACDEAKYELTFEGLWSRHTHPKDFPENGWNTKFSDVIGASHTIGNHFWRYGDPSTPGMKEMAEFGATALLEEELKEKGENVRTIIKARGISYPNVNGKTYAVFRVDSSHHLISIASKLYPSPDWFVGVSDLELCQANGQWVESREINLYPYDAGTDSGATYTSPDQPTRPQESIRRIKPNMPNDPRSPFYDLENKEMKPLAKIYITRQRLYEKTCDSNEAGDEDRNYGRDRDNEEEEEVEEREEEGDQHKFDYCATNGWLEWEDCNNPCGEGIQTRRRYYKNSVMATKNGCKEILTKTRSCNGTTNCPRNSNNNNVRDNSDNNNDDNNDKDGDDDGSQENNNDDEDGDDENRKDKECQTTKWISDTCSCQNGQSKKRLHREWEVPKNKRKCANRYPGLLLEKFEDCPATNCDDDDDTTPRPVGINCPTDEWTQFSRCSTTQGLGIQIRVRKPKHRHQNTDDNLIRIVKMYDKIKKGGRVLPPAFEGEDDITTLNVTTTADPDHNCYGVQFVESRLCGKPNKDFDEDPKFYCMQTPLMKKCSDETEIRYYYSHQNKRCGIFIYSGCKGTRNNFLTFEECNTTCNSRDLYEEEERFDALQAHNLVQERIDCVMTSWEYTACNTTCGEGYRWKFRKIAVQPQNGGKPCPRNVRKLEKCRTTDCELIPRAQQQQNTQVRVVTTTKISTPYCEYSEWSAWSPCSKSCGQSAVQIRTRSLVNIENSAFCNERLEQRKCMLMPCLSQNYNYRQRNLY